MWHMFWSACPSRVFLQVNPMQSAIKLINKIIEFMAIKCRLTHLQIWDILFKNPAIWSNTWDSILMYKKKNCMLEKLSIPNKHNCRYQKPSSTSLGAILKAQMTKNNWVQILEHFFTALMLVKNWDRQVVFTM